MFLRASFQPFAQSSIDFPPRIVSDGRVAAACTTEEGWEGKERALVHLGLHLDHERILCRVPGVFWCALRDTPSLRHVLVTLKLRKGSNLAPPSFCLSCLALSHSLSLSLQALTCTSCEGNHKILNLNPESKP